jgi:hypothetical protein
VLVEIFRSESLFPLTKEKYDFKTNGPNRSTRAAFMSAREIQEPMCLSVSMKFRSQ